MARNLDASSIESRFIRFLESRKFRKTPERFAILNKIIELNSHLEVETLHKAMEQDGYHVSRATVYNTVQILLQSGILSRNLFDGLSPTYELTTDNHIHLICNQCGAIREINSRIIAHHLMNLNAGSFSPDSFAVTIYGLCRDCIKKIKKNESEP